MHTFLRSLSNGNELSLFDTLGRILFCLEVNRFNCGSCNLFIPNNNVTDYDILIVESKPRVNINNEDISNS